ncbi:hypothetical protein KIS4809_4665 [Bacillus sp. ZZV12-4809]|nr:hypothetical protein KIS4809_4665 [Bacillus sp. ZZV12-4809]
MGALFCVYEGAIRKNLGFSLKGIIPICATLRCKCAAFRHIGARTNFYVPHLILRLF